MGRAVAVKNGKPGSRTSISGGTTKAGTFAIVDESMERSYFCDQEEIGEISITA